ncbi:MAG TPA: hypothetical protein VJ783_10710 [Pirellulales bacterium]|nr:hypothetical protein [Pirellulales bacterium]
MAKNNSNRRTGDSAALLDEWRGRLTELMASVKNWVEELDWSTRLISKKMHDSTLGAYEAPALLMQKETTRVLLDPIARFAPGTDGVADLYLMPAYDDIVNLCFVEGQWQFRCAPSGERANDASREFENQPLSKENLSRILDEIAAHAPKPF